MAYKFIKGKNRISGSQTFLDALSGTVISASYFVGDGSQLTNISGTGGISSVYTTGSVTGSGLLVNPITLKDPLVIGTVTASIGFNGNLYGTASNATQAQTASTLSGFNQNNYLTTSSFYTFTASYNTGTFSGSFLGTASFATSASFARTASYALNVENINTSSLLTTASVSNATVTFTKGDNSNFSITVNNIANAQTASVLSGFNQNDYLLTSSFNTFTSSYNTGSFSGSLIGTASYATSASYATTSAYAQSINSSSLATLGSNTFIGEQTITGNLNVSGIVTANELHITYTTSSVIYTSGSTKFGDSADDTHQFTGSILAGIVSGTNATFNTLTGTLYGTASYAINAATASYYDTSSLLVTASVSNATLTFSKGNASTFPLTINNVVNAETASLLTGFNKNDYLLTSSFNTFTASYNTGTFTGSFIGTASYATSASNTITASYALNANTLDGIDSSGFAILTASNQFTNDNTISGNLTVTGGLSIGNYIQMLPVAAITIPTSQTASYIYTSGSTNDLYFTQYQPGSGFNNTTRLRWLEGGLSTGLLHGGVVSTVNGTNTFNITSGSGIIVTYNASTVSDPYPTIRQVTWNNFVSQSLIYSSSAQITYVSIDENGAILQSTTAPTFAQFKDRIIIGRVLHQTGSITNGATNTPPTAYAVNSNVADFTRAFGPLKLSGHFLEASGSTPTLSLKKTAGSAYVEGRNYANNPNIPNIVLSSDDPAVTISKIYYEYVNSSGNPVIDTGVGNAGYTVIDPTRYNNGGTLASTSPSKYTIQRVYWFPRAVNRALFIYFGNKEYGSLAEAVNGIQSENFTEGDNTAGSAILVGYICVKGNATSLLTATEASIIQGGLFRGNTGGGGGSGALTIPGGSNHQVQFNDAGAFGGSANLTFDGSTFALTGALNVSGNVNFDGGTISGSTAQFTSLTASSIINNGGFVSKRTSVSTNTTLNSSQHIIGVDTATAISSLTLSLPNASTLANGQVYTVKDEGGMADTKTITISCSVGGQTIDGANSVIIESPYSAINIYTNGIDKYYIY